MFPQDSEGAPSLSNSGPFVLLLILIILDQSSKILVSLFVPPGRGLLSLFGGVFQVRHAINPALAWSWGGELPEFLRIIIFILVPLLVIGLLLWISVPKKKAPLMRYASVLLVAGLSSNLVDRIFRENGVVDIFSLNFGLGLRLPTFNIADMILLFGGLLFLSYGVGKLFNKGGTHKKG